MRFAPIAIAAVSLAACALSTELAATRAASADGPARCFRTDDIRNFRAADTTDLYIRTLRDGVYQIRTSGGCWDMDSALALAVTPALGGSSNICVGDPVNVLVPGGAPGRGVCRGTVSKSLTAEEVAALPSRARP